MANGNGKTGPNWWAVATLIVGLLVGLLGEMAFTSSHYVKRSDYRQDITEIKADIKVLLQRTAPRQEDRK